MKEKYLVSLLTKLSGNQNRFGKLGWLRAKGVICASTLVWSVSGSAADVDLSIQLPTVEVSDTTYRQTATKSNLPPELTPQSISVTDQSTLQMRDADSVNKALRYSSGVTTELRGGAVTRIDQFTIRGFANYQNSYDGLQLLFNGWNLQPQIDAVAVEQIEIFKGPTSSLYGNMPPGGFVNLIAKKPSSSPYHTIQIAGGSQKRREFSFESRGPMGDSDLAYSVVGLARKQDGQARTSTNKREVLAPSVNWRIGANTLINFNFYYQNDPSAGIYNTVPAAGSIYDTPYGKLDTDFYAGDANWNTFKREVLLPGYKLHHDWGNNWTFLHQLRSMDADAYQENTYNIGLASDYQPSLSGGDRILLRRAYLTDEKSKGLTIDNQLAGRLNIGNQEHNLLFGIDYLELDSDIRYEDASTVSIDLYAPNNYLINPATLDFTASGLSSDFNINTQQVGIYFQNQIKVNAWIVAASGRYDEYESREAGVKYGNAATSRIDQEQFTGRVGVLYEMHNGWAPYINFAESFEPMPGSDRNGNTFKPATAEQRELGAKYVSANKTNQVTFAAFEIIKENDLTRDPNGGPLDLIQTGETRSRGIEIEGKWLPSDVLLITYSYAWLDVEVTKDTTGLEGKTPVWVADHAASLWANYAFLEGALDGLSLGVGWRYVGQTQLDAQNTAKVPGYALYDLGLTYELGRSVQELQNTFVSFSATNLTDKRYGTCFDKNNCWFGSERVVKLGLERRL